MPGGTAAPSHTAPRVGPTLPLRVGWPGSIITHPDDLGPTLPALHRLSIAPLFALGPHPHPTSEHRRKPLARQPYSDMVFSGKIDFDEWLPYIAEHLDIGIAPLETSRFNEAKSWLKPLELAAAGTPFVASATSEYTQLKAGLLARKPNDWYRQLRTLLNDADLRQAEIERNRLIAQSHTYDNPHVMDDWAKVFAPWLTATATARATELASVAVAH